MPQFKSLTTINNGRNVVIEPDEVFEMSNQQGAELVQSKSAKRWSPEVEAAEKAIDALIAERDARLEELDAVIDEEIAAADEAATSVAAPKSRDDMTKEEKRQDTIAKKAAVETAEARGQ